MRDRMEGNKGRAEKGSKKVVHENEKFYGRTQITDRNLQL